MARIEIPEGARFQVGLTSHQIVEIDGVLRYKESQLMSWLCGHVNLNDMRIAYDRGKFSLGEYMQFYRDIGYSLCGFEEIFGEELEAMGAPTAGEGQENRWTFAQVGDAIDAIWPGDAAYYNDAICQAYIENAESIFSDAGWTLAEYSAGISNRLAKSVAVARVLRTAVR